MSIESTIDYQVDAYQRLYFRHHTSRRELQSILIEPLKCLIIDINSSLNDDKLKYEDANMTYHQKFHIFERKLIRAAWRYKQCSIEPLKQKYQQRKYLLTKAAELLKEITLETASIEMGTQWNGSIAVVYNPITARAEWKQYRHGGIHGVFNPVTREIEWEDGFQTGVYGVFNPKLNIVEWKKLYKGGVHGVYNPYKDLIEWQISFQSGIGGVYNPLTKEIEWKTSFCGGVVGYFDDQSHTVKWIEKWHHGIALITWDSTNNTYLTTASCGWYGNK